jgi:hypothetical protein
LQLLAAQGAYAQMWARQQAHKDEADASPGREEGEEEAVA